MSKYSFGAEALESRRFFAAGALDSTFNLTGRTLVGFGQQLESATTIVPLTGGSYVVAGFTSDNTGASQFALTKVLGDGTVDLSFGTAGKVTTAFANRNARVVGAGVTTDNKIVVGGVASDQNNTDFALARYNADGTLDTTFGNGGTQIVATGTSTGPIPTTFIVAPDGKLYFGASPGDNNGVYVIFRYNADGTLDDSFANSGIRTTVVPGGQRAEISSFAIGPNDSLIASGLRVRPGTGSDFFVAKYDSAGTLDGNFANNGFFTTDFAGTGANDEALDLAVQANGKIVVAGYSGDTTPTLGQSRFALLRLNTDGTLDAGFATNGKYLSSPTTARYESLNAVTILQDQRIIAAGAIGDPNAPAGSPGTINANIAVLRFTPGGTLDPNFGNSGIAQADFTGGFDEARSVVIDSDGRVVVAGSAGNTSQQGGGADFGLARFTADTNIENAAIFDAAPVAQGGTAVFTVTLDEPATRTIQINYTTSNGTGVAGTDYAAATGSITINPGETSKTIAVTTLVNGGNVNGATFNVTITSDDGITISRATASANVLGTGQQPPLPVVSINSVSLAEPATGSANAVFTVTIDRPSNQNISVTYATAGASATADADYTSVSGTVIIPAGQTTATITVPILADADAAEGNESFVINLTNPQNATLGASNQGQGTIISVVSALPEVSIANATVAEPANNPAQMTFTVTLSAAHNQPVTVNYATSDLTAVAGSDYVGTTGTVTIPAGQTAATFTVDILPDNVSETTERFNVTLSNPLNATLASNPTAVGAITGDLPEPPVASLANITVNERISGRSTAAFTVTLNQPSATDVTLNFATQDGTATAGSDYVAAAGTLTIPAGQTTGTINVTLLGDAVDEENETFSVVLSAPTGATIGTAQGIATVNDIAFRTVNFGGKTKATFVDSTGKTVTVSLNVGQGVLVFPEQASGVDIDTIQTNGTTAKSKLTVSVKKGVSTVNFIQANGPLAGISAKTIALNGDIVNTGGLKTVTLGAINNSISSIGAGLITSLTAGAVANSTLNFAGAVSKVSVASLTNSTIDVAPILTTFSTKGALTNSVVRAGERIKSFSAASMVGSRVLAGVAATTNALPTDASIFAPVAAASLGKVTVKAFADSRVIAPTIDKLTLSAVTAGPEPVTQGAAADTVKSASVKFAGERTTTKRRNAVSTTDSFSSGNFTIRIF